MKGEWILCWTSGHIPPRTMYYIEDPYCNGEMGFNATTDREKARRFSSKRAAENQWRKIIVDPEPALSTGSVRAELFESQELRLISK